MRDQPTIFSSLVSLAKSRKVQTAITSAITAVFGAWYMAPHLPPEQRPQIYLAALLSIPALGTAVILGIAHEDAAEKSAPAPVANVAIGQNAKAGDAPATTEAVVEHQPINMPSKGVDFSAIKKAAGKVTLPSLLALAALPLIAGGCSVINGCPELPIYRENLHKLDEALYAEHLRLVHEATQPGGAHRTPLNEETVQQQVQGARSLYEASRKGVPAAQ